MKKIFFFSLSFLFTSLLLHAQVDILQPPTEAEKTEVNRILGEYKNYMNATGDSLLAKEKKALATMKFQKEIQNNDVQVYIDLDSAGADNFTKIFTYAQKLPQQYPQTVKTMLAGVTLSKVKYDKIRKYNYIEASAIKRLEWYKVSMKNKVDSIAGKDTLVRDSVKVGFNKKLTFYIRFDKVNNVSKNFKLFAISKTGVEPKLEPLPPMVTWWLEMSPEWKAFFREKLKLQEYPTAYEVERVTGYQELDISNKQFTNLEPMRKMHFLRKLKCTNTPITSIEPLIGLESLEELDISKTKIKNLNGIDKLTKLVDLKCVGLGLATIEPLKTCVNLLKLDCSENELEDISPVKDLINLKELNFNLNIKIKTIDPVKNLIALEKISFSKIDARSLDALKNLVNLIYVDAYNTNITTLEPIRNHQKIIYLALDHNKITTLDPIKNYKFLTHLKLSSTSIVDFSVIKNFQYLRELDLSKNPQIVDLGPVHKLEYIKVFNCSYTKVNKDEVARFKKNHPDCALTYVY